MKTPLFCVLAMAVVWYVVLMPIRAEIEALRNRTTAANSEIQQTHAAAATLRTLEREVQKLESTLDVLQPTAGKPLDANGVIAHLQAAATDSHLRITAITPRNESADRHAKGQSVEIGIEGAFHDVGRFLGRLAASPRVMTSSDVRVKMGTSGRSGGVAGTVVIVAFDISSGPSATDEVFAYDDGGRRDPFASLLVPESPLVTRSRGRGLAATPLSDVVVRGVTRDGGRVLAILETSDRQSFIVRSLDHLADAIVHDIDASGVLFVQRDGGGGAVRVYKTLRPSRVEHP